MSPKLFLSTLIAVAFLADTATSKQVAPKTAGNAVKPNNAVFADQLGKLGKALAIRNGKLASGYFNFPLTTSTFVFLDPKSPFERQFTAGTKNIPEAVYVRDAAKLIPGSDQFMLQETLTKLPLEDLRRQDKVVGRKSIDKHGCENAFAAEITGKTIRVTMSSGPAKGKSMEESGCGESSYAWDFAIDGGKVKLSAFFIAG